MGGISEAKVNPAQGEPERSCDILYKKSSGGNRPGGVQEGLASEELGEGQ